VEKGVQRPSYILPELRMKLRAYVVMGFETASLLTRQQLDLHM